MLGNFNSRVYRSCSESTSSAPLPHTTHGDTKQQQQLQNKREDWRRWGTSEDLTRRPIDQPSHGAARNIESQTTQVGGILSMKWERKEERGGERKVCRELGNSYRVCCCSSNGLRLKSSRRERSHDDISSVIAPMIGLFVSAGPAPKSSAPRRHLHLRLGICSSVENCVARQC